MEFSTFINVCKSIPPITFLGELFALFCKGFELSMSGWCLGSAEGSRPDLKGYGVRLGGRTGRAEVGWVARGTVGGMKGVG
jgi:hypothetical protein